MNEQRSSKKSKVWILILTFVIIAQIVLTGVTMAWFTDKFKSETITLNFGKIELDRGTSTTTATGFKVSKGTAEITTSETLMPGDTINITITVQLTETSQDAYYLAYLDHDGLFSCDKSLFFKSGSGVYATDGTTTNLVGANGTLDTSATISNIVGSISAGSANKHELSFALTIDLYATDLSGEYSLSCEIYAIQKANITEAQAFEELCKNLPQPSVTLLREVINYNDYGEGDGYSKIGFYRSTVPATVSYNETLTTAYDAKVTNEEDKGLIKFYTSSDGKELAVVSDYVIKAPVACESMFSNFSLTSLDLSNFDTRDVTDMTMIFSNCYNLTNITFSESFGSSLTTMQGMFSDCFELTSLDLSNFDTRNVTDMSYMFVHCVKLENINLTGFDTSKVTNMEQMFCECNSLKNLDLVCFDTSNVTDMRGMFSGCHELTSLDLSNFDTRRVKDFYTMFSDTFGNNLSAGSTLIISDKFVYGATSETLGSTQFTKSYFCEETSLDEQVTVKRGAEILS